MKWTYSIKNKMMASLALLTLCVLVLVSNYLDRTHTEHVKNAIATLYEDRLIAEDYILKMTVTVYQLREIVHADVSEAAKTDMVRKLVNEFNTCYAVYIKTKLTTTEKSTANELLISFKALEQKSAANNYALTNDTDKALLLLAKLSTVQLEESKLIMKKAESEYANMKASSQFAFTIIIIILVVLQALVFSAKTLIPGKQVKDPTLN